MNPLGDGPGRQAAPGRGTGVRRRGVEPRVASVTPFLERSPALAGPADPAETVDPDAPLVGRWLEGDETAFAHLVRRHERRVFGLLLRMLGSREEAEDAAQDAFLNLHRHGRRFRRESRFSTFVYRVAVNAALNRRRGLGRRRAHLRSLEDRMAAGDDLPASPRGPEDAAYGSEVQERVQREIRQLSAALRAPLVLYDLEGLSYGEIAEVLQVAEGTVKSRIHRARHALRERLRDLVGGEEAR